MKRLCSRSFAGILLGLMLAWMSACASEPRLVDHAFSFDARRSSPDAEVLNYRYGDSNTPGARVQAYSLRDGKIPQAASINGAFPRGDTLYVKWRIKTTGEIFEDTVDLKSRLPDDITGNRIYFIIDGPQMYVYLISLDFIRGYLTQEEVAVADREMTTPHKKALRSYIRNKIITIYPDQLKTQETK